VTGYLGNTLVAAIAVENLQSNDRCTGSGTPFACCSGGGTGTCGPNSPCLGSGNPYACCTGAAAGTCQSASAAVIGTPPAQNGQAWTQVDDENCGTDLQVALYKRAVGSGDNGATQFSWPFTVSSNPSTFVGNVSVTLYGVGATSLNGEAFHCTTASASMLAPTVPLNNSFCTGSATPAACCSGAGTGTCTINSNKFCTGAGTPAGCCTGAEAGTCQSVDAAFFGIVGDNSVISPPGLSLVGDHSIPTSGPDLSNWANSGFASGSGANQTPTANAAGDNLGFQIILSP
jgi:hypothetical protein